MVLTKLNIRGKEFEVEVGLDGRFSAVLNEVKVYGYSLSELNEKLEKATKGNTVRVNIPLFAFSNGGLKAGAAIGIHAGNGNVLIKWEDGKTEQAVEYESFLQIATEEVPRAKELAEAFRAARDAWDKFSRDHGFRPKQLVLQEINKANKE